jgi:hypothetical protein
MCIKYIKWELLYFYGATLKKLEYWYDILWGWWTYGLPEDIEYYWRRIKRWFERKTDRIATAVVDAAITVVNAIADVLIWFQKW